MHHRDKATCRTAHSCPDWFVWRVFTEHLLPAGTVRALALWQPTTWATCPVPEQLPCGITGRVCLPGGLGHQACLWAEEENVKLGHGGRSSREGDLWTETLRTRGGAAKKQAVCPGTASRLGAGGGRRWAQRDAGGVGSIYSFAINSYVCFR